MFWGILAVYLTLSLATARTLMPWCDEAWFSGPALQLLHWGNMGTPVLDPTAGWHDRVLTGIGQYTYWITPLYPFSQFLWFHLAPFDLFMVRLFSVLWGGIALVAWWALVRKLTGDQNLALLAMAFVAVDSAFLRGSGAGRMDVMCAALGVSALAAYVLLRERRFALAVTLGHTAVAAAALVHPLALAWFAALAAVMVLLDARRFRIRHLACVLAPYAAAAAAWGFYIARDPALWWTQFAGNASHRLPEGSLLHWLYKETVVRFLYIYGFTPGAHGFAHVHILVLALYAIGAVGVLVTPAIRKNPAYRALALIWVTTAIVTTLVDQDIQLYYMPLFSMPSAVLLAVWVCSNWRRRTMPQWALAGTVAALVAVQLGVTLLHVHRDEYRRDYLTAAEYLKQSVRPGDLVFGSAELAFVLGFDGTVVDDYRLGYRSGRRATYIVLDRQRYLEWIASLKNSEPDAYRYIRDMLDRDYGLVQQNAEYQVYRRDGTPASARAGVR